MSFSRRQFLQASGIALCAGAIPLRANAAGQQQPLPVPPLLESRRGQPLFMTLQRAHWSFTQGTRAPVWGVNGRYLGPTIRVWKGDDVKLIYSNRLAENVSMTVAGLLAPGPLMGGPARMMSPNADWAPVLPIRQNAATLWYHANTPNRTAQQVYNGLAGMWLVEDEISKTLPIPNHYGVDDFPVIIQDKRLDNFGTPEYSEPGSGGFVRRYVAGERRAKPLCRSVPRLGAVTVVERIELAPVSASDERWPGAACDFRRSRLFTCAGFSQTVVTGARRAT
ncbi:SufI protein [Salmonella enterica subsp. arizonae]|uniref:SufI protein n=1 Tax=Salmonella enterica subsp. arizonae TaxID=59203 RepID=A0A379T6M5_SALER|nr:SufI protein [Salmonella enterica subsp. arizonae]